MFLGKIVGNGKRELSEERMRFELVFVVEVKLEAGMLKFCIALYEDEYRALINSQPTV